MVKEYDALSETGERELRLFFARKIKGVSYKTFLEDKKDVSEDQARHIVVSAWLAAKHHLSALGMRGLFVYFEDGTKRSFYELGMRRADSGKLLSMQEAGEILAEGDFLLSKGFAPASSQDSVGGTSSSPASSSVSEERVPTAARLVGMEAKSQGQKAEANDVGGIDLNPALLDLQIKRDGNGVPLPLPQQPVETMRIDGFAPIIINITPVPNLPMLLGLADTGPDTQETRPAFKIREIEPVSLLN